MPFIVQLLNKDIEIEYKSHPGTVALNINHSRKSFTSKTKFLMVLRPALHKIRPPLHCVHTVQDYSQSLHIIH